MKMKMTAEQKYTRAMELINEAVSLSDELPEMKAELEAAYREFDRREWDYQDEFETLECAKVAQINYTMFWKSSFVTTIMRMTRSSSTLDNPQIAWVPKVDLTRTWTDQELYAHFGLTEEEIRYIEEQVK